MFEGSEARQSLVKAIVDNLSESDFKTLADDASTDLVPTVNGLEDASQLMPGLESNVGAWAWLRAYPIQFASLGHAMSLEDLERLLDWGCIKINLPMLSLICAKSEAGQDAKDAKSNLQMWASCPCVGCRLWASMGSVIICFLTPISSVAHC